MKSKKEMKNARRSISGKLMLIGIILISIVFFIFLVSALTEQESNNLQSELNNLSAELSDSGYSWLANYICLNLEEIR